MMFSFLGVPLFGTKQKKTDGTTFLTVEVGSKGHHFGGSNPSEEAMDHKQCDKPGGECVHPKV